MKVVHNPAVSFFRGRSQGYVFGPAPSRTFSLARSYVYPTITAQNADMGRTMTNLKMVWLAGASGYRNDFKTYAGRYYSENQELPDQRIPVNNSFGNFVKGMWGWYNSDPTHVDLQTVTVADMISADCDMRTVARAVEAGFIPVISDYSGLTVGIG